ncbi:response regulator [bacterium]|nr:response regulator [bacterium]
MVYRILVVDDEGPIREILDEVLHRVDAGIRVDLADDGGMLVDYAGKRPYDLIIADWDMPGMTGVDAVRALRQGRGPNRHTPVFMMTGIVEGWEDRVREAHKAGANSIIRKPFDNGKFMGEVRRYMQDQGRA